MGWGGGGVQTRFYGRSTGRQGGDAEQRGDATPMKRLFRWTDKALIQSSKD